MSTIAEHNLLADHYTWLFGGLRAKTEKNRKFFQAHSIKPQKSGLALDLGVGSGFQSIPLAQLGYNVTAIDLADKLLSELKANSRELTIRAVRDDLINFPVHCTGPIELCVCMGDTLTHLQSKDTVRELFGLVYGSLENEGKMVITFRDLIYELKDLDRFITVRSDENKIFTCFPEYETDFVKVHDLIYKKKEAVWLLNKSFYRKCRIPFEWTRETLLEIGFKLEFADIEKGIITIIAVKY